MVYGVGYLGDGNYRSVIDGHKNPIYNIWHNILQRCYDDKLYIKFPTYFNCTIHDSWLCFQNFASWYVDNYYQVKDEKMCVDKDILQKHNKLYSPDTCCIVPNKINMLFTKVDKIRGILPIGVSYNKQTGLYLAKYKKDGRTIFIGEYQTAEEAFANYKVNKEQEIQRIAELYKNYIPQKIYNALKNYSVEYTD